MLLQPSWASTVVVLRTRYTTSSLWPMFKNLNFNPLLWVPVLILRLFPFRVHSTASRDMLLCNFNRVALTRVWCLAVQADARFLLFFFSLCSIVPSCLDKILATGRTTLQVVAVDFEWLYVSAQIQIRKEKAQWTLC